MLILGLLVLNLYLVPLAGLKVQDILLSAVVGLHAVMLVHF